jgi:hypothetical protein
MRRQNTTYLPTYSEALEGILSGWGCDCKTINQCALTCHPLLILVLLLTRKRLGELVYDVQEHGHQVRLASHANFRDFVRKEGLEFYPLGGDPKILAECMSPFSTALLVLKHSS